MGVHLVVQPAAVVAEPDETPGDGRGVRSSQARGGREPAALQHAADALLFHELQTFVVELVADLDEVRAPGVFVDFVQVVHLPRPRSFQRDGPHVFFYFGDVCAPRSLADHALHDDADEFFDLVEVVDFGAGELPQSKEGVESGGVKSAPLQEQRTVDFVQVSGLVEVISGREASCMAHSHRRLHFCGIVDFEVLVQGQRDTETCAHERTALLPWLHRLFEEDLVIAVIAPSCVVDQIHNSQIPSLLKLPSRILRLEAKAPPLLRVVPTAAFPPIHVAIPIDILRSKRLELLRPAQQVNSLQRPLVLRELGIDLDAAPFPQQDFGQTLELQYRPSQR